MLKFANRTSAADLAVLAKTAFQKTLIDKVNWIAGECYTGVTKNRITEINGIIEAYEKLRSVEEKPLFSFKPEEIDQIVALIAPFKDLEMNAEVRKHLIMALEEIGIDPKIFEPKPA